MKVSEVRVDETNDLVVHVYAFQNPEKHWLIGSHILHLYDFIRDIHGIGCCNIHNDLSYYSGTINYEFAWAYGAFGYGHSNQLRNTKIPVYDSICHSMFPRIAPSPNDLIDNRFRVRVPKRMRMITLYSLMVRVPVMDKDDRQKAKDDRMDAATAIENWKKRGSLEGTKLLEDVPKKSRPDFNREAKTLVFRRVKYARGRPVHVALNLDIHQKFMEPDFNQCYGEFICLRNRHDRLRFLTRMVECRLRDRYEYEQATELFHPTLDPKESRTVLSIRKPMACPPGYIQQMTHGSLCPPRKHSNSHEEDDQFVASITSAPRYPGYLAQVFGYSKPPNLKKKPVEKHEFKVKPTAFLGGGETPTDGMSLCQRLGLCITTCWYTFVIFFKTMWEYIFPTLATQMDMNLPEISVTLPSPADSTTEFYAHCVQEKIYRSVPPCTLAKRNALNIVKTARRKKDLDDEDESADDDAEDWDIDSEWVDIMKRPDDPNTKHIPQIIRKTRKSMRDIRPLQHPGKLTLK